jgi:hypothetical protein
MGYSNYKQIKQVVKKFHLDMRLVNLFADGVAPVAPSSWLQETLTLAQATPITNEKSKSERIVSPILLEASRNYAGQISFFSGEQLNVRPEDDLVGECDFFFSLHPPKLYMDAPIISLAEAKDENMEWGIAQCAAQMLGAKFYNEMENRDVPFIYGCATDGIEWQFLKLENDVYDVDNKVFTTLSEILGVWHRIIELYL